MFNQPVVVLFISIIEILCYSIYMQFIPRRISGGGYILYCVVSVLLINIINLVFYRNLGYLTALLYYLFVLLWMLVGYRLQLRAAVFHILIIFMSGHCLKQIFGNLMAASFWKQTPSLIINNVLAPIPQIVGWTIFGLLLGFILVKIRHEVETMEPQHLTWNRIALMVPAAIPVLYISYMTVFLNRDPTVTELLIEAVSSFCGLVLIIGQERANLANVYKLEIAELENSMRNQYERYLVSTEAAEQINQACHDLKNQILAFRSQGNELEQQSYLSELEQSINKYQAVYHTGNGVLDGLLFEKGKIAGQNGTRLLCFADGALLDRLDPVDLCTLFGNLLDNAIEACDKNQNPSDRKITLKVTEFREFVLTRCENPFSGEMLNVGQDFLSTKVANKPHGFGLKGIRHVVDKYGGDMTIDLQNRKFVVSILLPIN